MLFLIAALVVGFIELGHVTIGRRAYLAVGRQEIKDPATKAIFGFLYAAMDGFFILTIAALLLLFFKPEMLDARFLVAFIAGVFLWLAAVSVFQSLRSGIERPLFKLFQWSLFAIVFGLTTAGLLAMS